MAKKSNSPRVAFIKLKAKGEYKQNQSFETPIALKLLRLPNSAWELDDKRYTFEDNDIKRVTSKATNSSAEKS